MREKKRSIDSMPLRILRPRLRLMRFEVLPDFGLEALFRAVIGFKLHRSHFSQIMAMVISMRVVVSQNPAVISRSVMGVDQYHRLSVTPASEVLTSREYYRSASNLGI